MPEVAMSRRSQWTGAPVVRRPVWGKPINTNACPLNRSHLVRCVFNARGNIRTNRILTLLKCENNVKVTKSLVDKIRRKMLLAGWRPGR